MAALLSLKNALVIAMTLHIGLSLSQLFLYLFLGELEGYGGQAGFLAHTPVRHLVDSGARLLPNIFNPAALFGFVVGLGETLVDLVDYNYAMLNIIGPSDGVVYWGIVAFEVFTWLNVTRVGLLMIGFVISSGIMTSPVGLALTGLGVGTFSLLGYLGITN